LISVRNLFFIVRILKSDSFRALYGNASGKSIPV